MWVIKGPFDGLDAKGETKQKVLYPGVTYPLGRSSDILHLAPNVVSSEHATISIAPHSSTDAADVDAIPKLEYTQLNKKKSAQIDRLVGDPLKIPPHQTAQIQHGDIVYISGGVMSVSFFWIPVNVLIRSGVPRDERTSIVESLTKFGIKTLRAWSSSVTHVVFAAVTIPCDLKVLTALVHGAYFVSPAWLRHVVKRGNAPFIPGPSAPADGSYLSSFDGLEEAKFHSDGAGMLAWAPRPERSTLFAGLRFVHLTVPDASSDLANALAPGSIATQQILPDDTTTSSDWQDQLKTLRRKTDKKKVTGITTAFVVIGDAEALEQELGARWTQVYLDGLQAVGMRMVWLPQISDAVLKQDLSYIDCVVARTPSEPVQAEEQPRRSSRAASRQPSLPPAVPSTHPSEPSLNSINTDSSANTSSTLKRRVTKRNNTVADDAIADAQIPAENRQDLPQEPEQPDTKPEPVPQKTILKRRATAGRRAPSQEPVTLPIAPSPEPSDGFRIPSLPASRGLKRRVTGRAATASVYQAESSQASFRDNPLEPPHKKYKALFEGTLEPEGLTSLPEMDEADNNQPTSTRPESGSSKRIVSFAPDGTDVGSKRKAIGLTNIDEEVEDVESPGTAEATAKRRRTQEVLDDLDAAHSTQSKSTSDGSQSLPKPPLDEREASVKPSKNKAESQYTKAKGGGAIRGTRKEPDTEPQFLQALASRTKTKSKEDNFDREFNRLRIAVPDKTKAAESARTEQELAVWNDMEHDPSVRGNFMVVEYCDLMRKDGGRREKQERYPWSGLPNFKKFKKKDVVSRVKVELELPPPVDYGLGDSYWEKDDANITMAMEQKPFAGPSQVPPTAVTRPAGTRKKPIELRVYSSEEEEPAPIKSRKKPTKKAPPTIDLHFSEEDEPALDVEEESEIFDMNVSAVDEDDDDFVMPVSSNTLKSTGSKPRSQRPAPPSTGPSQSQRSLGTTSSKKRFVQDDPSDDDDPMAFKGFARKKTKR